MRNHSASLTFPVPPRGVLFYPAPMPLILPIFIPATIPTFFARTSAFRRRKSFVRIAAFTIVKNQILGVIVMLEIYKIMDEVKELEANDDLDAMIDFSVVAEHIA